MADPSLQQRSGFAGIAAPGNYGAQVSGASPCTIREIAPAAVCRIAARRGADRPVIENFQNLTGLPLPSGPKCAALEGLSLIGVAPGQWLTVADTAEAAERLRRAKTAAAWLITVTDQSDALGFLELAGPNARDVLAKGCPLDLDPRVFGKGDAATTQIALIGCHLWQVGDAPAYRLAVPRSFASSFWSWLAASAAEYGYVVQR